MIDHTEKWRVTVWMGRRYQEGSVIWVREYWTERGARSGWERVKAAFAQRLEVNAELTRYQLRNWGGWACDGKRDVDVFALWPEEVQ